MHFIELVARLAALGGGPTPGVFLVGGTVRDGLLGRPLADVDVAVAGDAREFGQRAAAALGGTYVPLGERFGACRIVLRGAATSQHLDLVSYAGSIESDLRRRDFTVNAMAVAAHGFDGDWAAAEVLDPTGGRADLASKTLRMVAPTVLDDDPLRLLRAVRFVAELGFALDGATTTAVRDRAVTLASVAPERVRAELCRVLAAEGAVAWIELLDDLGLLDVLLPELTAGRGVEQPKEHHWDVFTHQVETVATAEVLTTGVMSPRLGNRPYLLPALERRPQHPRLNGYFAQQLGDQPRSTLVKLAALLHDVGKPATKTIEPSGRMRFFGHPELGAQMVEERLHGLRFSQVETSAVCTMVGQHMRPAQWRDSGPPTQKALFKFFRDLGAVAIDTIFLNLADHLGARGPSLNREHWDDHVAWAEQVITWHYEQVRRVGAPRPVTGDDLMRAFGLRPGKRVGELLLAIDEARAAGVVASRDDALALAAERLVTKGKPAATMG